MFLIFFLENNLEVLLMTNVSRDITEINTLNGSDKYFWQKESTEDTVQF